MRDAATYDDLPTVTLTPPPVRELRFELAGEVTLREDQRAKVDAAWSAMRRDNPGLHDGRVLLVDMDAFTAGRLVVRPGPFRLMATAREVGERVRALGVQAVLIGQGGDGREHVLMGRRSAETRLYHGQWENAPSGSVEPPAAAGTPIDEAHCVRALLKEGVEELGIDLGAAAKRWLGMLEDAGASSIDVVLELRLPGVTSTRGLPCPSHDAGRWEYVDTAWVAVDELPAWVRANERAISRPTRALVRWMGLVV
jgi:8-oxo-dGTP pyrophosphatase MutT (NUDIX family)